MIGSLLSGHWLPLIGNIALQSLLVPVIAAVVLLCVRKASAARRHLIAIAPLGVLLLLPLSALVALMAPASRPLMQVSRNGFALSQPRERTPLPSGETHTAPLASAVPVASSSVAAEIGQEAAPTSVKPASHTTSAGVPFPAVLSGTLLRLAPWLAALWLLGVLAVIGRLRIGFVRLGQIARRSEPILSAPLQASLTNLLTEAAFARPLTLLQVADGDRIAAPMTWGARRAVLLLPADAEQWPAERLRAALLHELAHIRRHDWLTQVFGQIACALYWFHPLVWRLNRYATVAAECACDDAVLLAGVPAKEYATHLLDVAQTIQAARNAPHTAIAMARPAQLHTRLESLLNARCNRKTANSPLCIAILAGSILLLGAVAALRPLAWAGERRQSQVSGSLAPIGPVIDLPNGISVELVGVGSKWLYDGDGDWWTPNGKALQELPVTNAANFAWEGVGESKEFLTRNLFVRLHITHPENKRVEIDTTGYIVVPPASDPSRQDLYSRRYSNHAELLPTRAGTGTFGYRFPLGNSHGIYRFGVASGPWQTVATAYLKANPAAGVLQAPAPAGSYDTTIYLSPPPYLPSLAYRDSQGRRHRLFTTSSQALTDNVAQRIIALDSTGKEIELESSSDSSAKQYRFPASVQAQVAELRLQTCPYEWAEFKQIALQPPMARPPAIATPTVSAPFRHTFVCGITLTVPAVSAKAPIGSRWWKPDGQPLAGSLKEYSSLVNFWRWENHSQARGLALHITSPRSLAYSQALRFVFPPSETQVQYLMPLETSIEKNHPGLIWESREFPTDLAHITMRYGVAAGPWKTAARIPMPADIIRTDPNGTPSKEGLILSVPTQPAAEDLPTLEYRATTGKLQKIPFQLFSKDFMPDVARRFVGIDKAGHVIPLPTENTRIWIVDSAGQPIPLDPTKPRDHDMVAGEFQHRAMSSAFLSFAQTTYEKTAHPITVDLKQIREFQLQVRPYEWAEFRNIVLQPDVRAAGAR